MTRAQWLLVCAAGMIAIVAFMRTEQIAQRIGMAGIIPARKTINSGTV